MWLQVRAAMAERCSALLEVPNCVEKKAQCATKMWNVGYHWLLDFASGDNSLATKGKIVVFAWDGWAR